MPLSPLIAIDTVEVFDAAGLATPLAAQAIEVDSDERSAADLLSRYAAARAGRGTASRSIFAPATALVAEDVPAPLRLAIKIIVARWFENRGDVAGEQSSLPKRSR